jgi:hypothetical protein
MFANRDAGRAQADEMRHLLVRILCIKAMRADYFKNMVED